VINKDIFKAISEKEMDRKDFLKYSGLVLLGLVGFKSIASILMQPDEHKTASIEPSKTEASRGFGGGKYGA
jgi:hypothetical protein